MKMKIAALVWALFWGEAWSAEPIYPATHPTGAIEDYGADTNYKVYPVYFWWEKGNLWIEIDPKDATPSMCGSEVTVQQNGKFGYTKVNTATKGDFCDLVYKKQVFRVVDLKGNPFNPAYGAVVEYDSAHRATVTLPPGPSEPDPSPAPEFGNPKVSIHDLDVLKVTCQRKNKKVPGSLLTEGGSYICDGLPLKPGDKVTITIVGNSK